MVVQDRTGHLVDFQLERLDAKTVRMVLQPLIAPDAGALWMGSGYSMLFA